MSWDLAGSDNFARLSESWGAGSPVLLLLAKVSIKERYYTEVRVRVRKNDVLVFVEFADVSLMSWCTAQLFWLWNRTMAISRHIACGRVGSFDMDIRMNVSLGRELSTITSHTDHYWWVSPWFQSIPRFFLFKRKIKSPVSVVIAHRLVVSKLLGVTECMEQIMSLGSTAMILYHV